MKPILAVATHDLRLWRRTPMAIAAALIPPLAMALLLVVLTLTVTKQPVALVVEARGYYARKMRDLIASDTDAYDLRITDAANAQRMLDDQEVAAIITISKALNVAAFQHNGVVHLELNNIDTDFADDIRRSVERSIGTFDAPALSMEGDEKETGPRDPVQEEREEQDEREGANRYRVAFAEHDLRSTNVDFLHYQVTPVLVLLVLNVGVMGTALLCARDRERGVARMLVLAPVEARSLVAGRLLGGAAAAVIALVPALGLCALTRVVSPPIAHWPALIGLFLAASFCASELGALLGAALRGERNVALAATVLSTYLFFLGGGFTTIAFLPGWLRSISALNPFRYAIDGMRQALFYPDLTGCAFDILVLAFAAVVALLLGGAAVSRTWRT